MDPIFLASCFFFVFDGQWGQFKALVDGMVDSIFGVVLLLTAHIKEATVHLSVDTRTALGASFVLNF
jgi:hypothetical protein